MSNSHLKPGTIKVVSLLEGLRKTVYLKISELSETEALHIPDGFKNSVHWHLGHMLHVQLAHWYVRRGLVLPIDLGFRKYFRDGSSPSDYDGQQPSFEKLLELYRNYSFDLISKYGEFLEAPLAQPFEYMNSHFSSIEDDLYLLVFHEGEHYPMVMRLIKAMQKG